MVSRIAFSYCWVGCGNPFFEWQKIPIHLLMNKIKLYFAQHTHICWKPILHSFPITFGQPWHHFQYCRLFHIYLFRFSPRCLVSIWYCRTVLVTLLVYNSVAAMYALLSRSVVTYFGSKWFDFKSKKQLWPIFSHFQWSSLLELLKYSYQT